MNDISHEEVEEVMKNVVDSCLKKEFSNGFLRWSLIESFLTRKMPMDLKTRSAMETIQ